MNYRTIFLTITTLTILMLSLNSCKKENNWTTSVEIVYDITMESVTIEADYSLFRNDNYVFVGVCLADQEDPTVDSYFYGFKQKLSSGLDSFIMDELNPNTTYYIRSFIRTNDDKIIYSENKSFKTSAPPIAPCETTAGQIKFNADNYIMDDLDEAPSDNYKLSTSCALGELNFTFKNKPTNNVYTTISSVADLTNNTVRIDGILGGVWTCYYGVAGEFNVYVTLSETGEISIEFCDLNIGASSESCPEDYILMGEVHQ